MKLKRNIGILIFLCLLLFVGYFLVVIKPQKSESMESNSYRPDYHFSVPDEWKNDPQRPFFLDGQYHYYYLYNQDYSKKGNGTAWRHAVTSDNVNFQDKGVSIPKYTTENGDIWSGSPVIDKQNTAGFGKDAIVSIVTQQDAKNNKQQAQFLWYSTDKGESFRPYSSDPVLANPGTEDFRDPKIIWDEQHHIWIMALAEGKKIGFYRSGNLKNWTYAGGFIKDDIGVLECPDLFKITADDGADKWVLGVSANGKAQGLPNTYAYWTGDFDGYTFHADNMQEQWLDYGFDWYAAVTWKDQSENDNTTRFALAWMNNWDYPNETPTIKNDHFNGTDSIVRTIRLHKSNDNSYYLASSPVAELNNYVQKEVSLNKVEVNGTKKLPFSGQSYEFEADVSWDEAKNVGVQLRKSQDGKRHIDVGIYQNYAYVNRQYSDNPDNTSKYVESRSPFNPSEKQVHLQILVDRTSVEVFFNDGQFVHSSEVFPKETDQDIDLYSEDGTATFSNIKVRQLKVK